MAQNIIRIEFDPCQPAPANGYLVKYKPIGSLEDFRTYTPNPFSSPVEIIELTDPAGTSYEGTIQGDCGGGVLGPANPWEALNNQSGSQSASGSQSDPCDDGNPIGGVTGNTEGETCFSPLQQLYLSPPQTIIQPGATLYYDACLTELVTGFTFVKDDGGQIFFLHPIFGIVGSPTGNSC